MGRVIVCLLAATLAGPEVTPARLRSGSVPDRPPAQVVGGGDVLLELAVGPDGALARVATMRDTAPFTELLRDAVADWTFEPATADGRAVRWPLLLAGVFRPPVLVGPAPGSPPRDAERPCAEIPFPLDMTPPPYPPAAVGDALVLLEVTVGKDGRVTGPRMLQGSEPFASAARDTARQWRFRPACRDGGPLSVPAYLVFGFRAPVTPARPPRSRP
jgi:TonB family protein